MEMHRIPQNVIGYEGRIVGKFTARQFTYLAVGGIAIFIILTLPIDTSYRFALCIIPAVISMMLAVLSYEGRGSDVWVMAFLKAMLSPTQRIWKKHEQPAEFLSPFYQTKTTKMTKSKKSTAELESFLQNWGSTQSTNDQSSTQDDLTRPQIAALKRIAEIQTKRDA